MKQMESKTKRARNTVGGRRQEASAGTKGLAISPPEYGIDIVAREPVDALPEPSKACQPRASGGWPSRNSSTPRKAEVPGVAAEIHRAMQDALLSSVVQQNRGVQEGRNADTIQVAVGGQTLPDPMPAHPKGKRGESGEPLNSTGWGVRALLVPSEAQGSESICHRKSNSTPPASPFIYQFREAKDAIPALAQYHAEDTECTLYDWKRVKNGKVYGKQVEATGLELTSAVKEYIAETRNLGTAVQDQPWLDKEPANLAAQPPQAWDAQKGEWITNARGTIGSSDTIYDSLHEWDDRDQMKSLHDNWGKNDRAPLRGKPWIGALDPFQTKLTVADSETGNTWTFWTQWSTHAYGYITRISEPSAPGTARVGTIKPKTQYEGLSAQPIGPQTGLIYSAAHTPSPAPLSDLFTKRGEVGTRGEYGERFDAITKLAAEGARFSPMEMLGDKAQWDSRFYVTLTDTEVLYATYEELIKRWGPWFGKGYSLPAERISVKISELMRPSYLKPRAGTDYDLANKCVYS